MIPEEHYSTYRSEPWNPPVRIQAVPGEHKRNIKRLFARLEKTGEGYVHRAIQDGYTDEEIERAAFKLVMAIKHSWIARERENLA